jgi:hypothetical protein
VSKRAHPEKRDMEEVCNMEKEMVSKKTMVVILIFCMMLSVFGTLASLSYLGKYQEANSRLAYNAASARTAGSSEKESSNMGTISFEIIKPEEKQETSTTGFVALEINK